jgi:hypothetical protein
MKGKQAEVVAIEDAIKDDGEPVLPPKPHGKPGLKRKRTETETETEVETPSPRKLRKRA